jgi:hypothetical protein
MCSTDGVADPTVAAVMGHDIGASIGSGVRMDGCGSSTSRRTTLTLSERHVGSGDVEKNYSD